VLIVIVAPRGLTGLLAHLSRKERGDA
jgi:hypothetical protein